MPPFTLARLALAIENYWTDQFGSIGECKIKGNIAEIELLDDDGEPWYIGNCTDPGLTLEWLGEYAHQVDGNDTFYLVRANDSVVLGAKARHICGWAWGFEGVYRLSCLE